jgi:hypothetical protein
MMPRTAVVFFLDDNRAVPLLDWLDRQQRKVQDKCLARVERLRERGFELRRPVADYLRDGVYELRVRYGNINYRMLYFFHDKVAVLSHGLTKEGVVPDREIELAILHSNQFRQEPDKHTFIEESNG